MSLEDSRASETGNAAVNGAAAVMGLPVARLPDAEEPVSDTAVIASPNGEEKMEEIVENVESFVQEMVVVHHGAEEAITDPNILTIGSSVVLTPGTTEVVQTKEVVSGVTKVEYLIPQPVDVEETETPALHAVVKSQLVSAESPEAETDKVLSDPAVAEPLTRKDNLVEAETNEPVKMEVKPETRNMQEGGEAPVGNTEDSIDKDLAGDMDDLLDGGGEKYDEERDEDRDGDLDDLKELSGEGGEYDAEAQHSLPISERRKHKRLEVFVGGLDKDTTDEDLKSVFEKVGEVVEVRLMRNPQTGKNKGYAFIRYSSAAMAKRAAEELEHVEIRGRPCGVLPSEENDTLFLGNISKSWKKEQVLETLKSFGTENVEELTLMEDPQLEGINRGFAFIEFSTHKEALKAFRRLQQADAIFGSDRSAKVAWAQPLNEPDEDTMSQVKSVFVDGMPPTWDEEKVREHFGNFGEIERIVLARNMLSAKRKDFGFVNYVERDAAMACIEAMNNTEISDGDIKMKVKVMLAKPQVKSKPAKGGVRGGYPLGFRGDHRVGSSPGRPGRGGAGLGPYDAAGWGGIARFENQGRFGGGRDRGAGGAQRADRKTRRGGKRNYDEMDSRYQLLHLMRDQAAEDDLPSKLEDEEKSQDPEEPEGAPAVPDIDAVITTAGDSAGGEQPIPIVGEIVMKPTLDKFECAMCGFGSDAPDDFELHKKTKVHRVIEGLRKDQKLHNKTPLSLLHEYASRNHCEVNYETKAETNGPFEVIATIGGAAGGTTGPPTKGFGAGRNKARAKQMAAADALEKIMEKVPESEFTKPGQSRQRFGDRDRPGRKGKGGLGGGGGGGGGGGYRNSRVRPNDDWRSGADSYNNSFVGVGNFGGGGGGGRNRRHGGNDMFFGGGGSYPGNPNTIPLSGYNDFPRGGGGHSGFGDRYGGRGGGGYHPPFRGGRGGMPTHSETYAERYDRIQGGRGYGGGGYGGRDYVGGGGSYGGRDMGGSGYGGRDLPPAALGYGSRDLPPGGYGAPNRDFEGSAMKRPYAAMDEENRFVDAQRGLPRQRLEAPEQVPVQPAGGAQGYVAQPMYADANRAPVVRPQEQQQYNAYVQQPQGVPVGHNIGQAQHVPTQQARMPVAMVGGPAQGGTPYSIYDAAPQPTAALPTGSLGQTGAPQTPAAPIYTNQYTPAAHNYATSYTVNQDYMVNTPAPVQEMTPATSYPTQSAYGAQYSVMQQVPQQGAGAYALQGAAQQQTYY